MQREDLAVSGRNWGQATIEGGTLVFTVAGKPAFRVPLKDVGQVFTSHLPDWLHRSGASRLARQ